MFSSWRLHRNFILATAIILFVPVTTFAQHLKVIGWNVESGGAQSDVIANQIESESGIDIWGLSEVKDGNWANQFVEAAAEGENADFQMVLGSTGRSDKLMIIYNDSLLDLVRHFELHDINPLGRVRAPLVAHFRVTSTGTEFLFMVNHLYRSKADKRHEQSRQLNDWVEQQSLPVIAVGDYNYDWSVPDGDNDHDPGYDLFTADGVVRWVRPETLIPTQCSHYNSVLDFIFINAQANQWNPTSKILEEQASYCPDNDSTSDHRPILASFEMMETEGNALKQRLLRKVESIDAELEELHDIIKSME